MTTLEKLATFSFIVSRQDLGYSNIDEALNAIKANDDDAKFLANDFLTRYLVNSIVNAGNVDEIESDLRYAIDQLNKAVNQIVYLK